MKTFQNNVKIFGAIRQSDHMNQIEEQRIEGSLFKKKCYILYPNDRAKTAWNVILIALLVMTGILTPLRVCFVNIN